VKLEEGSISDLGAERWPGDPVRMLVMRRYPRGLASAKIDLWIPDAGPSAALLERYRQKEIDWETFSAAYQDEQQAATGGRVRFYNEDLRQAAHDLHITVAPVAWIRNYAKVSTRSVLLLCWERDGHCHRKVLKDLIEEKG